MDRERKVARRRQLRKRNTDIMRKASFVADYIQSIHPDIYSQAVGFYDKVDRLYPNKKDLKKTVFYKKWKIRVARQQATPSASTQDNAEEESPTVTYRDNLQLRIQLNDYEQGTDHAAETSEKTEIDEQGTDHAAETSEKTEIYEQGTDHPVETSEKTEIDEQDTDHAAETSEKTEIDEQDTDQVDTINPSMFEEVSPQLLEKIIEDLRNEPELKDIVTSIEEQISFEQEFLQLGMDLDIPELENWENWEIW